MFIKNLYRSIALLFLGCILISSSLSAQTPELLYYRFDGTGTSVPNQASSPPSGTGTATIEGSGLTQGSNGQCGGALIGTGAISSTNYLNTGWAPNLASGSWTLSFWIKNIPNYTNLWYIFGDANSLGFRCFTNGVAGPDNFLLRGGFSDVEVPGGALAGPQAIAFVYDSSLGNIKAYLNGTLVNTVAQAGAPISGAGPLKIGGYSANFGLAAGSQMDEFRLYNRALSATEVAQIAGDICGCYADVDGDGYGDPNTFMINNGSCPSGYVSNDSDCDDFNNQVYPDADELCDGLDNNCDNQVDIGSDLDEDGYTTAEGDCDDCDDSVNPGETEICDGIDNNCNGQTDELANASNTCTYFYGFSPFQDSVWTVDTALNYAIVQRRAPLLSGFTVTGINGAAKHPLTDVIYVIAKISGVSGRVLCTFNPANAQLSQVGNLGDNFASITFSPSGTLYGVTGDGATVSETLYEINPATASKTLLTPLGNGDDGEVICYNPSDNMIYHWSGNGTVVFEKILPVAPYTVTDIPIIGTTDGETFGAAYIGNNKFLISNINSGFNRVTTAGNWSAAFGSMPDDLRGLPFGVCNPSGLPSPWSSATTSNNTGSASYSGGSLCSGEQFTLSSTGFLSSLTGEAVELVSQTKCGNSSITVRIANINGGGWAGVMMRESTASGSKMVALKTQLGNFARRESRATTNGVKATQQFLTSPPATWLRLVRSGNIFSYYTSFNGTTWNLAGSATISMSSCLQVGMFVESINVNTPTTAVFGNVTITGSGSIAQPVEPTGAGIDAITAESVSVYPNPTSGELTVDLSGYASREVRLIVYNANGQVVKTIETNAQEQTNERIDLSTYQNGIYLIRVQSEGLADAVKRVVLYRNLRP